MFSVVVLISSTGRERLNYGNKSYLLVETTIYGHTATAAAVLLYSVTHLTSGEFMTTCIRQFPA